METIRITVEVNGSKRGITVEESQRFTGRQFGELVENTINDERRTGYMPLRMMNHEE